MIASMHITSIEIIIIIIIYLLSFLDRKMQSSESFNDYFTKGEREKKKFRGKKYANRKNEKALEFDSKKKLFITK